MAYDEVKRWVRDRVSNDGRFPEHPKKTIKAVEKGLEGIKPDAREAAVVYVKRYVDAYYLGKHKMQVVPEDVRLRVSSMEALVKRANAVDKATEYLQRMGPPAKVLAELGLRTRRRQSVEVRPDGPAQVQQKVVQQQHGNVIGF